MSRLRWYLSTATATVLEITDRVRLPVDREGVAIAVGGKANQDGWEGDLLVDDTAGDIIPLMYRRIYCNDDDAPSGGQVVGNWFISNLKVVAKDPWDGIARTWTITMTDENSLLDRRKFVGSDANRPSETDIERIRWMLASTELNVLDPNEDFIDTTGPITLDAVDCHNQSPGEILSSIMGRTGKHYWVMYREDLTPHVYTLWYANMNTSTLYTSTISLSNVGSEIDDPTSTLVYPLSGDAELDRAGGRMASGLLGPWKQKVEYIQDTTVGDTYAYVDQIAGDLYNVTTEASAIAQITRQLAELGLPDDEITTTWNVESDNLNLIKHGMLVPVHASHFPNYTDDSTEPGYATDFVPCRVMERTVRQVGPTTFEVPLRLSPQPLVHSDSYLLSFLAQRSDTGTDTGHQYGPAIVPRGTTSACGVTPVVPAGTIWTYLDGAAAGWHDPFRRSDYPIDAAFRAPLSASEPMTNHWGTDPPDSLYAAGRPTAYSLELAGASGVPVAMAVLSHQTNTTSTMTGPTVSCPGKGWLFGFFSNSTGGPFDGHTAYTFSATDGAVVELGQAYGDDSSPGYAPRSWIGYLPVASAGSHSISLTLSVAPATDTHWACVMVFVPTDTDLSVVQFVASGEAVGGVCCWDWTSAP